MNKFTKIILVSFLLLFQNSVFAKEPTPLNQKISYSSISWIPMSYEKKGIPQGLYIDILKEVLVKHLKKELKVKFYPWKRAQKEVKDGYADFLITVPTPSRLKYAVKSEKPFFLLYLYIYTYKNHPKIDEINKIKNVQDIINLNLKVVTNFGNGWHKENLEEKGVNIIYVPKRDSSVRFLARKRADILIDAIVTTNHLIKERNLISKISLTKSHFGPIKMHLLMSKKSHYLELMPEINRVFSKLEKEGIIKKAVDKYNTLE